MKMRNKIFGILITLVIMIGVMASQVNAADISASAQEVNVGDTVTVTVKLDQPTQSIGVDLTYDANSFEYKSVSSDIGTLTENAKNPGVVKVAGSNATGTASYITFTFVAKANTDAADFVASNLFTHESESLNTTTTTVAVVEKAEEPTTPEEPENPTQPETPGDVETPNTDTPADTTVSENNGDKTNTQAQKVDENGNVITKLPQTGTSVIAVAGVVAAVAVVAVVAIRKLRK